MRALPTVSIFGLAVLLVPSTTRRATERPDEILARMAQVYATATSYQDTGAVETAFFQSNGTRVEIKPFTTRFVRPDRFWFHYQATDPFGGRSEYIISQVGGQVHRWFSLMGTSTPPTLAAAVGEAAGVSSGSSHTIPALLLPDAPMGQRLSGLTPVTRLDDAKIGTIDCYRIQNGNATDQPLPSIPSSAVRSGEPVPMTVQHIVDTTVVWIDKASYLVRRIETHKYYPQFRTEAVTSYDPMLNGPIADSLFVFLKPPGD